ncbi:phospholipase D-like domain-containing protein [Allorhodopirellula solitaria]|uniref:Major cardiolipin synthase ClsA n=1 Tax=Allorhodopirellula solitaria TaxID=2527987 RepID=A0A5C5X004_9BACT|nr:phospholipase D-like domain-containing protein [Allorhodopirellula solitaria]TWT55671.1 Major cardiolipin synthase ClsA [Allorhodopirellula solitaria]
MIWIVAYLSSVAGAFLTIIAMTIIRHQERHSVGKVGWMGLVLLSPPVGLLLFLWLGGRKVSAEHESRGLVDMPRQPESDDRPDTALERMLLSRDLCLPTEKNRVRILTDVRDVRQAFLDLIESGKEAIYITTFILDDKQTSSLIVDRLCEKARAGVQVRLLVDGFGSFMVPEEQLQRLRDAGGRAVRFKAMSQLSRLAYLNFRNHRKLAVCDGQRAILGGANIVEDEMTDGDAEDTWIDLSLWIEGPAAPQLQSVFCSDWNFETEEELPPAKLEDAEAIEGEPTSQLTVMPIGPDGPAEILDDFWQFAIHHAEKRIWICTPYCVPPPSAMRALELACRRGIDVRIMVPQVSDLRPVDYARYDYFRDLVEHGGRVFRYGGGMVHAKLGIVDDMTALVGSANFDVRSFFLNYELSVVVHDQPTIERLSDWYADLMDKCEEGVTDQSTFRAMMATTVRLFASEL